MNLYDRRGYLFQSTPPARGATAGICLPCCFQLISIHAPREGGDFVFRWFPVFFCLISIHAPARGATAVMLYLVLGCGVFQSTPPARGATSI